MPADYYRVAIQGNLPGGEVWSVNPAFIANFSDPGSDAQMTTWAKAIAAAFADSPSLLPQQLAQLLSGVANISNVRVSHYDGAKVQFYADAPLSTPKAGTGTLSAPTTSAMVISLQTGAVGRSGRGRVFWPALNPPLDSSTGRFTRGALPQTLLDFQTMIVGIENAAPAGVNPVLALYSSVKGSAIAVEQLRIGDVVDSQRRRKDALKESYATLAM